MFRPLEPQPELREQSVLNAAAVLEWRCRMAGLPLPRLPEAAVLTHQTSLLPRRPPWSRDRSGGCLSFEVRLLSANGHAIAMAACRGPGAGAAAVAVEELAVVGVRRLLLLDICGSLDSSLQSGDILRVDRAIAGDGTSPHYTPSALVGATESLTRKLHVSLSGAAVDHRGGIVWSTDAVYRETPSQIERAREQGAVAVDMETASVLAVAGAVGIEVAALLVVADELFEGWRPPANMAAVNGRLKELLALAPLCLL